MSEFYKGMAEILEVDENIITSDFELNAGDATWDSLAVVSTIALIDELYSKTLDGKRLTDCLKISDIENLIAKT
jgi:acyl carrier protein